MGFCYEGPLAFDDEYLLLEAEYSSQLAFGFDEWSPVAPPVIPLEVMLNTGTVFESDKIIRISDTQNVETAFSPFPFSTTAVTWSFCHVKPQ